MTEPRSIRKCNVAVVGGAGFLGSHCVGHLLQDRKCNVTVIDNLVAGSREYIWGDADFVHADITVSEAYLRSIFVKKEIEYVFNWAAYPYIPDSFARPLHVFNVNANGALNVINAAQEAGCKGILQISSAEIYGGPTLSEYLESPGLVRLDENATVAPHSSYGAAKAAIDAMVQVRWREAGTPCIALRQFNCVGERETHPYVVPEIISQLYTVDRETPLGEPRVIKLGNNSYRDFLYAGDAVAMAVELLEKGQYGEVYNSGSEGGIRIYDLARLIGKTMRVRGEVVIEQDPARCRPWEIWHLASNNAKLYSVIDYRPKTDLREALERAYDSFCNDGMTWTWQQER